MRAPSARELRERWTEDQIEQVNSLLKGGPVGPDELARLGLPWSTDDARGLRIRVPVHQGISRLDLSHCAFESAGQFNVRVLGLVGVNHGKPELVYGQFTDLRLDHGKLQSNLRGVFLRCSFLQANLGRSILGGSFTDCAFDGANLAGIMTPNGTAFVRCTFRSVRVNHANFLGCRFEDCVFED